MIIEIIYKKIGIRDDQIVSDKVQILTKIDKDINSNPIIINEEQKMEEIKHQLNSCFIVILGIVISRFTEEDLLKEIFENTIKRYFDLLKF